MSYPRKRALLACDFCRQRKRRCDGRKPVCGNCAEAEADCHYQELPLQRLMSGNIPSAMAKRLERIEALLKIHSDAIASIQSSSSRSPLPTNGNQALSALEQDHDDIEHDIPAVLTYLATSGQNRNNSIAQNESTPGPDRAGIRKSSRQPAAAYEPAQTMTPDVRVHNVTHVPSPPNSSTSSTLTPSVSGASPKLAEPATLAHQATIPDALKPGSSASSLLAFPTLRSMLGDFPDGYFFRLETQRASVTSFPPQAFNLPYLNRDVTDLLVTTFFSVVYPSHPILSREVFFAVHDKIATRGLGNDVESALCLVVFALGVVASSPRGLGPEGGTKRDSRGHPVVSTVDLPGMEYFAPAQQILMLCEGMAFGGDVLLVQALALSAIYLAFVGQPVKSWKMNHKAATQLQLLMLDSRLFSKNREVLTQIACTCFSIETDLRAELNLPESGISKLLSSILQPRFGFMPPNRPAERDDLINWSEASIQKIMSDARSLLYVSDGQPMDSMHTLQALSSMTADFERQLAMWYDSLPTDVKPRIGLETPSDDGETMLRLRYHEAKQVIHKPFVLYLASLSPRDVKMCDLPPFVIEKARSCLESCRLYVQNAGEMLKKPSRHTWAVTQCTFSAVLLCTIASLSPRLSCLVPDATELQRLALDDAVRWASPESSTEAAVWVLADIGRKQRFR